MTREHLKKAVSVCLIALVAASGIADAALAQTSQPNTNPSSSATTPPAGQYAPPPPGYQSGSAAYDDQAQQADRAYADAYSRWAAQYCVDQHNNNTAAGAIIGGVLGAAIGAGVAHHAGTGALIGGAVGAGAGAAVGASTPAYGCPPGYVVAAGAPPFVYSGPYWGPAVTWAPAWYQPWVWVNGHWVYYPYRYWYWWHRAYWRPGWYARPWHYHYYRW